ncbi:hypothetical protein P872_14105 [Rhodonellum psychrophilum GCM71 = DSM 17998]|uniref:Uncharacterized protein n=2 Tax=Rhodonellum TaxID=336827 RepID=U5BQN2_9BACT|nr:MULTISPECIES: hypothetical protein [Rhodonellum]ERM80218.1 hypothetical protein P872_14105 [Rhodonellum psychrophilum GCM71 = DSM 17998]SDZ35762.1 hypothetical protein SAMN05444412_11162 [Rhodonellum ikkaensis]
MIFSLINKGTGTYGAGGTPLTASDLLLVAKDHPLKSWTDKSNLTGSTVISNIIVDALGHPTNWSTRNLSTTDIGAEPSFLKNTAFNKNFGTVAGTVAQGNDTRILNGQTAFGYGNHNNAGYLLSVDGFKISGNTSNLNQTGYETYYRSSLSPTNKPASTNYVGMFNIRFGDTNLISQLAIGTANQLFTRYSSNAGSTFGDWVTYYNTTNLRSNTDNDSRYVYKFGDTITGLLTLAGSTQEKLILKGNNSGVNNVSYLSFTDSNNVRQGFLGMGSAGDNNLSLFSDLGDVILRSNSANTSIRFFAGGGTERMNLNSSGNLTVQNVVYASNFIFN